MLQRATKMNETQSRQTLKVLDIQLKKAPRRVLVDGERLTAVRGEERVKACRRGFWSYPALTSLAVELCFHFQALACDPPVSRAGRVGMGKGWWGSGAEARVLRVQLALSSWDLAGLRSALSPAPCFFQAVRLARPLSRAPLVLHPVACVPGMKSRQPAGRPRSRPSVPPGTPLAAPSPSHSASCPLPRAFFPPLCSLWPQAFLSPSAVCLVAQSCPALRDTMDLALQAPLSMGLSRSEYWVG